MAKRFQFRLRTLLLAVVPVAAASLALGYYLRRTVQPQLVPVTGIVKFNGVPLDKALILFAMDDHREYPPCGLSNAAGRFDLSCYVRDRSTQWSFARTGAMIGHYRVVVVDSWGSKVERDLSKYTSGLTAEVTEDGPNVFDFNLTTP